jgi:hypothetical protein
VRLVKRPMRVGSASVTRRLILQWLAAMVAVLVAGIVVGLIWADTSDVAGFIAVVTNLVAGVAIVALLIALVVVTRRQGRAVQAPSETDPPRRP